jgi:hypothetical protein
MKPLQDGPILDALPYLFVGTLATIFAIFAWAQSGRPLRGVIPHMDIDQAAAWSFAIPVPIAIIWNAGDLIVRSQSGYWPAVDYRSSPGFVLVCRVVIVVVAPAVSLFGLMALRRFRTGKRL